MHAKLPVGLPAPMQMRDLFVLFVLAVRQLLVPVFERYSADPSKWVRQAAFQHLGPFIATLTSAQVRPSAISPCIFHTQLCVCVRERERVVCVYVCVRVFVCVYTLWDTGVCACCTFCVSSSPRRHHASSGITSAAYPRR